MYKRISAIICLALVISLALVSVSFAQAEQASGDKAKTAWQKLFSYPANVAKDSATTVAETGKKGVDVVANEAKTVGQVTSGDVEKTGDLVTEPVKGTAEAVGQAVVDTANIPVKAATESE